MGAALQLAWIFHLWLLHAKAQRAFLKYKRWKHNSVLKSDYKLHSGRSENGQELSGKQPYVYTWSAALSEQQNCCPWHMKTKWLNAEVTVLWLTVSMWEPVHTWVYLGLHSSGRGGMSLGACETPAPAQSESKDAIFVTFQTLST